MMVCSLVSRAGGQVTADEAADELHRGRDRTRTTKSLSGIAVTGSSILATCRRPRRASPAGSGGVGVAGQREVHDGEDGRVVSDWGGHDTPVAEASISASLVTRVVAG
jgi:hypothetical protein